MLLPAEKGGRTVGADRAFEGISDGFGFAFFGCDADHFPGGAKGRNGQGEGVGRHGVEARKVPFPHLLHFTGVIELHDFDGTLLFEASDRWIVEGEVTVFADAEAAEVDWLRFQEGFVAIAFFKGEINVSVDEMEFFWAHERLNTFAEIPAEARFVILIDPEVFVHVEEDDFGPIDSFEGDELFKELNLGIAGGEDRGGGAFFLQSGAKKGVYLERGVRGEVVEAVEDLNGQVVRLE